MIDTSARFFDHLRCPVKFIVILLLHCSSTIWADDSEVVRRQISATWDGFESINCVSIEQIASNNGRGGQSRQTTSRIIFGWRNDGRSTWSRSSEHDGKTIDSDIRNDGAKRVFVHYFDTPPKEISLIRVSASNNQVNHYSDLMFSGLWAFMPAGRTVATILNEGGTLTNTGSLGTTQWTLKVQFPLETIEATLDETHQFLPKKLTIRTETRQHQIQVDRFDETGGFCYPAEGTALITYNKPELGQSRIAFRLEEVEMNRSLPHARYIWTQFPPGALVEDALQQTNNAIGGKLARTKLVQRHPTSKKSAPTNEPLRVATDPGSEGRGWAWKIMLSSAIIVGGLGIFLRRRGL